jgi:hypothetical protein
MNTEFLLSEHFDKCNWKLDSHFKVTKNLVNLYIHYAYAINR